MKKALAITAAILLTAAASQAFAQKITNSRIVTTITTQKQDRNHSLGRDFWLAPAQNYLDEQGKYIRLFIASPNNTTAFVESQGVTTPVRVSSYGLATFDVPLALEMKSSGVVEDKAIHVYDNTDDISVYLTSHNLYSSDGTYIIPTIGWGTDYVVASFASLYDGPSSYLYDLPSEFTISADQDNTLIEITPSCDLREAAVYPVNDTIAAYKQGQKFSVLLDRGQSIQYQAVLPLNGDDYDVTGTVIHSNVGIGVIGASMCANIPQDFGYCNYITEMIPPTRSWGETYYTTNPAQPSGLTNKDQSLYLMISSKPGQKILTFDPTRGSSVEAVLGPAYDHYFDEQQASLKWYSDAPFLLVQYLNSASYPDEVNGNGNPAEVIVQARENYGQNVIFAVQPSNDGEYDSYANVIVNVNDGIKRDTVINGTLTHLPGTLFDGKSILTLIGHPIDDTFEVFTIPHVIPGVHTVSADPGFRASVSVYGYGFDNSYAWGESSGVGTVNSPDTVAPIAIITGDCSSEYIHLTDSGYLPGSTTLLQTGLNYILLDTDINMQYMPDLYPNWVEGSAMDTSGIGMFVINPAAGAKLVVDVFDAAGNETIITSVYTPQDAAIVPPLLDFGIGNFNPSATIRYDSLFNLGKVPFKFTQLSLKYGNRGFTIISPTAPDSIPVGGKILVEIAFTPVQGTSAVDSIIFGDQCMTQTSALIGSGGAPDFYVSDVAWQNVPLNAAPGGTNNPMGLTPRAAVIHNLSKTETIHVSSNGWGDRAHFAFADTAGGPLTSPVAVAPDSTANVWFWFAPTDLSHVATQASWTAPEVLESDGKTPSPRFDSLTGNAITPMPMFTGDTIVNLFCLDSSVHSVTVPFPISNSGTESATIVSVTVTNPVSFTNLTLVDQHGGVWDLSSGIPEPLPAGAMDAILAQVPVSFNTNSSVSTQIIANFAGHLPDTVTATVNVNYSSASLSSTVISFGPAAFGSAKLPGEFTITNTSASDLAIDTIMLIEGGKYNSSYSFTTDPPLPDILSPGQAMTVNITFDPSVSGDSEQNTVMQFFSDLCDNTDVDLDASLLVSGVSENIAPLSQASVVMLDDGRSIRVIIPSDWTPPVSIAIYNILGESVFSTSFDGTASFDLGEMPRGVYFYRLRDGESSQTGKILLGQ